MDALKRRLNFLKEQLEIHNRADLFDASEPGANNPERMKSRAARLSIMNALTEEIEAIEKALRTHADPGADQVEKNRVQIEVLSRIVLGDTTIAYEGLSAVVKQLESSVGTLDRRISTIGTFFYAVVALGGLILLAQAIILITVL